MAAQNFAGLVLIVSQVIKDCTTKVEHGKNGDWRMWVNIDRRLNIHGDGLDKLVKYCKKNEISIGIFDQSIMFLGQD